MSLNANELQQVSSRAIASASAQAKLEAETLEAERQRRRAQHIAANLQQRIARIETAARQAAQDGKTSAQIRFDVKGLEQWDAEKALLDAMAQHFEAEGFVTDRTVHNNAHYEMGGEEHVSADQWYGYFKIVWG